MKPGDVVRVKPSSVWRGVIGNAEGQVVAVVGHTRRASVRFEALGLTAEGGGGGVHGHARDTLGVEPRRAI